MAARIGAAWPVGSRDYFRTYGRLAFGLGAAASAVAIAIAGLASYLMRIYGEAYAEGAVVLAVHTFALVPVSIAALAERWLVDAGLTRASALNNLTGLAVNIVANLVLLPRVGLVGAAWSTLIAYTAAALVMPALDPRQRRLLLAIWRAPRLP